TYRPKVGSVVKWATGSNRSSSCDHHSPQCISAKRLRNPCIESSDLCKSMRAPHIYEKLHEARRALWNACNCCKAPSWWTYRENASNGVRMQSGAVTWECAEPCRV